MNRNLAFALATGAIAAAALAVAAIASSKAYAEDSTIDPTPFVGSKSRAERPADRLAERLARRASASASRLRLS